MKQFIKFFFKDKQNIIISIICIIFDILLYFTWDGDKNTSYFFIGFINTILIVLILLNYKQFKDKEK